jgi:hypothetical protein
MKHRMPGWLKGYPAAATRGLLGTQYADVLAVPPSGPARAVFEVARVATRVVSARAPGQGLAWLARITTKRLYRDWIDENGGKLPAYRHEASKNWKLDRPATPQPSDSVPV